MVIALTIIAHLYSIFEFLKRRGNQTGATPSAQAIQQINTGTVTDDIKKVLDKSPTNTTTTAATQIKSAETSYIDIGISSVNKVGLNMSKTILSNDKTNGDDVQLVEFEDGGKINCFAIYSENVKVVTSAGKHDHGSSKVKLKNFVDYKWEEKHYPGHLIAVHCDGKYIAYAINVNNKATRMEGMVRVVNANAGLRALIKGMSGEVLDLQFANIEKQHLLASIDMAALYVHKINMTEGSLVWNLMIKVVDPIANYCPKLDKIAWCPYVSAEEGVDEDENHLIAWARGNVFQCFDLKNIISVHGAGIIKPESISAGYMRINEESLITWVALSPDGTTLAAACSDGIVRFYQIYLFDEKNHRCLHQWKPHNGKSLSSLFFLDNITRKGVDYVKNIKQTYWKYAITGAENNTEFKVWDCSMWECMQTVKITTNIESQKSLNFIAEIDRSANYLVITSLETRAAYIMQILRCPYVKDTKQKGFGLNLKSDLESSSISDNSTLFSSNDQLKEVPPVLINSIAEFPLSSGILSFSIVDASICRFKCSNEDLDDYDDEPNSIYSTVVHMFIVQSKSMQECHIIYQSTVAEFMGLRSSLSNSTNKSGCSSDLNSSLVINNTNNSNNNDNSDTLNENDDGDDDHDNNDDDDNKNDKRQPQESANPLNVLFAAAGTATTSANIKQGRGSSTSTSSAVIAVAAAAAAAPSAVAQEPCSTSQNTSPLNTKKAYLMTPDEFISPRMVNANANAIINPILNEKKSPENVNSNVLNTILMLASVTGQAQTNSTKSEKTNLMNLVNSKLVDLEQKKLHLKQNNDLNKKFIAIDSDSSRNAAAAAETLASGGSSPSREVQEIMSIHEKKFLDELSELIELPITPLLEHASADVREGEEHQPQLDASVNHGANNWDRMPADVHTATTTTQSKQSAELKKAANIMSQAVNATNKNKCNNAPPALTGKIIGTVSKGSNKMNANNNSSNSHDSLPGNDLSDLNAKIDQLIDLVQVQSKQIHNLESEIVALKKSSNETTALSRLAYKLEVQISKLMEHYVKRFESEHTKAIHALAKSRETQNRELRESFIQIVNQYLLNQVGDIIVRVLNSEIQRILLPAISTKIDDMQQKVQMDVKHKFASFNLMIKENIGQVCKSKQFIDAFGNSVLIGVQNSLQAAFIESMGSTLIPAYEKSSQMMFKQLHDAFTVGIKDFLVQFDNYLQHLKPMQDSSEQLLNKFGSFRQHLETTLVKHCNVVSESMHDTQKEVKSLEILLGRQIQEIIRTELRKNFENQNAVMRSQANTPAPIYDMKQTIKHLLHQGQINKAFHQALLANDLKLVEYTLKVTDILNVFTPKCCLEQKVLLSLIQQVSADMSEHNEVKQNYLSEALLAINPEDPIAREHAPKVLQDLYRSCQQFLKNYPKSPHCSNIRMTMKGVHSYMNQF